DSPTLPNCTASAIRGTKLPGGNAIDGGNLLFQGLQPTAGMYVDLGSGTTSELRATVTCLQGEDPTASPGETGILHACDVPTLGFLAAPQAAFGANPITVSATGGSQSGEFTSNPIAVPPVLTATGAFNPGAVDPRQGITAEWIPTPEAPLVMIEVIAIQGSGATLTGVQVLCLDFMATGRKVFPQGALALAPAPSLTEPVTVVTSLAALNFENGDEGWGNYIVGVGRGTFGINVLLPGQ
ncbi:MAG: hypothetical protein AAF449_11795, partial [Myxococcota bacterium]